MPIQLPDADVRTTPPIAEKVYPLLWLYNLVTVAPSPTDMQPSPVDGEQDSRVGSIRIEALPMSEDGSLLPAGKITVATAELYRLIDEVPEVALAFDAVLAAVLPAKKWVDARQARIENRPEA
jgi:hypothetical protein